MNTGIFGYVDVLKSAADASWTREQALTNNIANVDTPNYKRQDVEFSSYLKSALEQAGTPGSTLTRRLEIWIHRVSHQERTQIILHYLIELMVIM